MTLTQESPKRVKDMTREEKREYEKRLQEQKRQRREQQQREEDERIRQVWASWNTFLSNAQGIAERTDNSDTLPAAIAAMGPEVRRIATLFGSCSSTGLALVEDVRTLAGLSAAKIRPLIRALVSVGFLVPDFQHSELDPSESDLSDAFVSDRSEWHRLTGWGRITPEEAIISWVEENCGWRLSNAAESAIKESKTG